MTKTQTRAICQICGREQAVLKSGRMSKHGYTVDHGWFNGVCSGEYHVPVQVSRVETDKMCADIRSQVAAIRFKADAMEAGKIDPESVFDTKYVDRKSVQVARPFSEASEWEQDAQRKREVFTMRRRAEMGEQHAEMMTGIADKYHGQPVRVVEQAAPAARIEKGDRKVNEKGSVMTVDYVDGARVYWTRPGPDGRTFRSWTGTQAWRKMKDA